MVDIVGFENEYAVSRDGRVWSHKRNKWLCPTPNNNGYLRVRLRSGPAVNKMCLVHRIVASAYIPNFTNKPEVHHIDADRLNNCVENLQWVTREENNQAAWDCGNKTFKMSDRFVMAVRKNAASARLARRTKNKNKGANCNTI